ncbi:hypothetical protein L2E82_45472 [Cichorium intybus]|uniref:Uncharacterized protein n=1 Tax=Cichorium intybus TaxID=13427 RepID=A0ACB8ZUF0_CICIN|nr:hypothetical protein L2E82_45472 [Cichorium intybus]
MHLNGHTSLPRVFTTDTDRGDIKKGSAEIFFCQEKFWKENGETEAPPVFNVHGVNYFHVKVVGLLFVATTRANVSPSLVLELVQRIGRVTKDYLGILNEDCVRKYFVLVYELLHEITIKVLKSSEFNEPIMVDSAHMPPLGPAALFMQGNKRIIGTAVTKSIVANEPKGRKREDIFILMKVLYGDEIRVHCNKMKVTMGFNLVTTGRK